MPFKSASSLTKFTKLEIEQLFSSIKLKFRKSGLEILLAPRSLDYARLLLCVARRFGNSPTRNLFKRRVRAIFYEEQIFKQNFDWVFVVKSKLSVKQDFVTLKQIVHDIHKQAIKQNK
jgi:ribonuclease P protein component